MVDAKGVLSRLRSWQVCHTKRKANCAANSLVKVVVKHIMDRVWIEDISECIHDVVILKQFAITI